MKHEQKDLRNSFLKSLKHNQSFGITKLEKNDFDDQPFGPKPDVKKAIQNYFEGQTREYYKLVWLTKEFLENKKKFKYPIGACWNTDSKKWRVHPGSDRIVILDYFGNSPYETLCFNNSNKPIEFEKQFSTIEEVEEYFNTMIHFDCTYEFNSVIPHFNFATNKTNSGLIDIANKIDNYWNNTFVSANFDIHEYGVKNSTAYRDNRLKIIIDNLEDKEKALILAPLGYDVEGIKFQRV